jgi:hypothetical protein
MTRRRHVYGILQIARRHALLFQKLVAAAELRRAAL